MIDLASLLSRAPVSAAAIAAGRDDGNCPTCQLSGVPPEQAARESPRWYQALQSIPALRVPDQPAACCWDCRCLIAAGLDPAALVQPIAAELAAMSAADRRVAERIADMGELPLPEGAEDRAVERARSEGVL